MKQRIDKISMTDQYSSVVSVHYNKKKLSSGESPNDQPKTKTHVAQNGECASKNYKIVELHL